MRDLLVCCQATADCVNMSSNIISIMVLGNNIDNMDDPSDETIMAFGNFLVLTAGMLLLAILLLVLWSD